MNDENKNYPDTKVYFDGSHYIGIPKDNYPHGKGCKSNQRLYPRPKKRSGKPNPTQERAQKYSAEKMKTEFETAEQAKEYTEQNIERKRNNAAKRNTRLWRKIYTQRQWDFFANIIDKSKRPNFIDGNFSPIKN